MPNLPAIARRIVNASTTIAGSIRIAREVAEPVREKIEKALADDDQVDLDERGEIGREAAVVALGQIDQARANAGRAKLLRRYDDNARETAAGHAGALIATLAVRAA